MKPSEIIRAFIDAQRGLNTYTKLQADAEQVLKNATQEVVKLAKRTEMCYFTDFLDRIVEVELETETVTIFQSKSLYKLDQEAGTEMVEANPGDEARTGHS